MKSSLIPHSAKPSLQRSTLAIAVSICALLAAGAYMARRSYRNTYLVFPTRFGKCRIYQVEDDFGRPVRLLEVGGIVQSGTYIDDNYSDRVFEYLKMYDLMFEANRPINRVCVLGCGGYDYPEHLIATRPKVIVDAVEIDPQITALARRYFFLDRAILEYEAEEKGTLNLIEDDALDYLLKCNQTYDAIVNDVFDGGTPPAHLCTRHFLEVVHNHLSPEGLYLTNIVASLSGDGSDFLVQQIALMSLVFKRVYIFPCMTDALEDAGDSDNIIVVATDYALPQELEKHSL